MVRLARAIKTTTERMMGFMGRTVSANRRQTVNQPAAA
jgi:hypothetical protein